MVCAHTVPFNDERGFIRAETMSYKTLSVGKHARQGKGSEGRDYIVQEETSCSDSTFRRHH
jgi:hypothetical protein